MKYDKRAKEYQAFNAIFAKCDLPSISYNKRFNNEAGYVNYLGFYKEPHKNTSKGKLKNHLKCIYYTSSL